MSKTATMAFSFSEASSAQGEVNQVDLGPYSTAASPGDLGVHLITGQLTLNPIDGTPIYLVVEPLAQTLGSGPWIRGETTDGAINLSDQNPSFLPVIFTNIGGEGSSHQYWATLGTSVGAAVPFNVGWI